MFWIGRAIALNLVKGLIRLKFPRIRRMTTVEFADSLEESATSHPLVLDARSEAEYDVSHLKEARRMDAAAPVTTAPALEDVAKDTPIVVYCSVGYRSAKAAQQLEQAGFCHVFNLEGGLFQWANEGRSLVQDGQPTQLVHPYSAAWGMLLNRREPVREK